MHEHVVPRRILRRSALGHPLIPFVGEGELRIHPKDHPPIALLVVINDGPEGKAHSIHGS
jgi:hypothetical protein